MPLSDRQIKNTKPAQKSYKISDGHGLYLLVKPNGGKNMSLHQFVSVTALISSSPVRRVRKPTAMQSGLSVP